jgi:hypothetical protein
MVFRRYCRTRNDDHPVSFQLFVRVARFDLTRRMWDMTMAQHAGSGHSH